MHNGLVEQAARLWRGEHAVDGDTTRREPKDGDVVRIAPECGDISLHPLQGSKLIHVRVVALILIRTFAAQRRKREETEASNSIVHGDKNDTLLGELNAGRHGRGTRTAHETAAV